MFVLLPLLSATAAEPEVDAPTTEKVRYKPRTELDFDAFELTGAVDRPGVGLVTATRQEDFNPMIVLRASFSAEMRASVDAVK